MPTTVFTAATNGGDSIDSFNATYTTARSGSSQSLLGDMVVGQWFGGIYGCREAFVKFDTSSLPDGATITSVLLEMKLSTDSSVTDFIAEVYVKDWGAAVDTGDWVAGASLSGLTRVATIDSNGIGATNAYKSFTSDAAFLTAINTTGTTYLMLASSRHRAGSAPSADEQLYWAQNAGNQPKLTVTYASTTSQSLSGGVSFTGSMSKVDSKVLTGGLSFTGGLARRVAHSLTGILSFSGAVTVTKVTAKALSGALSFSGAVSKRTLHELSGGLSFSGTLVHKGLKSLAGSLSFVGTFFRKLSVSQIMTASLSLGATLSTALERFGDWLSAEMRITESIELMTLSSIARVSVKGPDSMAYKRGTDVLFEVTFTDKTGQNFDPDTGTAKLYVKLIDPSTGLGTYITGYDRATGGKVLTKTAVGVYEGDVQFLLTDTVGQYEVEMEGFLGTKRFLDSVKVAVKS